MSKHSILVAVSGSEQSRNAAETAWLMAKKLNASVTAEHVIDSRMFWEMLRSDSAGFVGSGPYVQLYEQLIEGLKTLAEKLRVKYIALAEGNGVKSTFVVKEANLIETIANDASKFDLLAVGHVSCDKRMTQRIHSHYVSGSIAEGIAQLATVPLLVVQERPRAWEAMSIVSEVDHVNVTYIRSCLKLALLLGLKPSLEFWGTGTREESPEAFKKNLLKEIPDAKGIDIDIEYFDGKAAAERKEFFHRKDTSQADKLPAETIFVLPTRGVGPYRITAFGKNVAESIRSLTLPCIMLWPEEYVAEELAAGKKNELSPVEKRR